MKEFQTEQFNIVTRILAPSADLESRFTFYYDETNNIRKFYVRESDFNAVASSNFILGGLAHEGIPPDMESLVKKLNLQKSIKEIKLKHITKGEFLECLDSEKLTIFLRSIFESKLYIHYSSLNVLYWSLVDIVDSAIVSSPAAMELGPDFANSLKTDLYIVCKAEISKVISIFHHYGYPNIKSGEMKSFIEDLTALFDNYLDTPELHFGLESLRQILNDALHKGDLTFITNEEDHILIKDFSQFYLRPIYTFKNSTHIFDNEETISEIIKEFKIMDGQKEINNYTFVDSEKNLLVQLSDVFIGLMGKCHSYLNNTEYVQIFLDFKQLNKTQLENIDLFIDLIDKSNDRNMAFLHASDSHFELGKFSTIRKLRGKP